MIPKIIHYCWFGGKKKSPLAMKCIASWKKYLCDYEIKEWNEKTFDVKHSNKFVREAYKIGKYAFVADYVRLYALYEYGGIYLDTDVEVIKPFDDFLNDPAFIGYEDNAKYICLQTGVIGAQKNNIIIKNWLQYYEDKTFILPNGKLNERTNVDIITTMLHNQGLILDGKYCNYRDLIFIYPKDFFCPKDPNDNIHLTNNTVCIHYYSGSWCVKFLKSIYGLFN